MSEKGIIQSIFESRTSQGEKFLKVLIAGKEYQAWRDAIAYVEGKMGQEIEFVSNTKPAKGNYPAVTYLNKPRAGTSGGAQENVAGGRRDYRASAPDPMRNASMFYSYAKDTVIACIQTGAVDFLPQDRRLKAICDAIHIVANDLYKGAVEMAKKMDEGK